MRLSGGMEAMFCSYRFLVPSGQMQNEAGIVAGGCPALQAGIELYQVLDGVVDKLGNQAQIRGRVDHDLHRPASGGSGCVSNP